MWKENGVTIEVYEDGDCLLTPCPGAYVQLSAALIARLAQPVVMHKSNIRLADFCGINNSVVKRSIRKLENESGWQCTLSRETGHNEVHIYVTRNQARHALFGTQIGKSGRIA